MSSAKEIELKPIPKPAADRVVKSYHYSGKVTQNSQLSFGVFLRGVLLGALQFGPPIDKRRMQPLVPGTLWHEFLELNRMAFAPELPRNSESRALAVAFRIIRAKYPQIKWVISFADATQCGDGAIYRAAGFDLIGVNKNTTLLRMPDGTVVANKTLDNHPFKNSKYWRERGAKKLDGHQIKYIYFLDPAYRDKLSVPILPYSAITKAGASMYKGERIMRDKQAMADTLGTATGQNRSSRSTTQERDHARPKAEANAPETA